MGDGIDYGLITEERFGHFVYWAVTRHPKDRFDDATIDRMIRAEFPDHEKSRGGTGAFQAIHRHRTYAKNHPDRFGIQNEGHSREVLARIDGKMRRDENVAFDPNEVSTPSLYIEGAVRTVAVNAYERNPNARRACVEHYGYACAVCEFDFAGVYGAIGEGFIHVHHLRDLATVGEEYEVDPIQDLRPVCPNCHAMLHRETPAMSISKLRSIVGACR